MQIVFQPMIAKLIMPFGRECMYLQKQNDAKEI